MGGNRRSLPPRGAGAPGRCRDGGAAESGYSPSLPPGYARPPSSRCKAGDTHPVCSLVQAALDLRSSQEPHDSVGSSVTVWKGGRYMPASEYWNPKTETASRDELAALQLIKLRRLCEWAAARSPWYRESFRRAGFEPDHLRSLDDLRRIPPLTRDQWMASQAEHPPFGALPVAGPEAAIRYHTTSGTTGREPLRALDSAKDWAWQSEMWCYGMWGFGVRPSDVAYVAFGYGSFIGFWGLHYGLEKIGALNIPGGAQTTESRVKQIVGFGATAVASTPTYALRLAQEADRLGIDLAASRVRRLILSGEPAGSIPQTKALIERLWGAKAGDTAGMTEIGTIMIFECSHQPGGTHIIEDHFIEEVMDPASDEPVGYGEQGERVVTSFGRGIMPLLRYRSADLVCRVPASRCRCGRSCDLYDGGIHSRPARLTPARAATG